MEKAPTGNKTRKAKPLIDPSDQLRGISRVLSQLIVESTAIPADVKKQLVDARNSAFEKFVAQEKELNAKVS